jgi:hypothetical protein
MTQLPQKSIGPVDVSVSKFSAERTAQWDVSAALLVIFFSGQLKPNTADNDSVVSSERN